MAEDKAEKIKNIIYNQILKWSTPQNAQHAIQIAEKSAQQITKLYEGYIQLDVNRPRIVCLCGSTRFSKAFQDANLNETLAGKIVLSIGCDTRPDTELWRNLPETQLKEIVTKLDELHKRKIDLADEVLILNVGGYIGESTRDELEYAKKHNKIIRFLETIGTLASGDQGHDFEKR